MSSKVVQWIKELACLQAWQPKFDSWIHILKGENWALKVLWLPHMHRDTSMHTHKHTYSK